MNHCPLDSPGCFPPPVLWTCYSFFLEDSFSLAHIAFTKTPFSITTLDSLTHQPTPQTKPIVPSAAGALCLGFLHKHTWSRWESQPPTQTSVRGFFLTSQLPSPLRTKTLLAFSTPADRFLSGLKPQLPTVAAELMTGSLVVAFPPLHDLLSPLLGCPSLPK